MENESSSDGGRGSSSCSSSSNNICSSSSNKCSVGSASSLDSSSGFCSPSSGYGKTSHFSNSRSFSRSDKSTPIPTPKIKPTAPAPSYSSYVISPTPAIKPHPPKSYTYCGSNSNYKTPTLKMKPTAPSKKYNKCYEWFDNDKCSLNDVTIDSAVKAALEDVDGSVYGSLLSTCVQDVLHKPKWSYAADELTCKNVSCD